MDLQSDDGLTGVDPSPVSAQAAQEGVPSPAIDVEKLADKVYRLMREELRLCKVRGHGRNRHRLG